MDKGLKYKRLLGIHPRNFDDHRVSAHHFIKRQPLSLNEKGMERELILLAIEEYNKYHSPEAIARLKEISGSSLKVEFYGPFCAGCEPGEWFEDLRIELWQRGVETVIDEVLEMGDEAFLVKYSMVGQGEIEGRSG